MKFFAPISPAAPRVAIDSVELQQSYARWRNRILFFTILGYATFYFVRKNLSIALPLMEEDLRISKSDLGLFLTLHGVLYGISKFVNGILGDRCNARAFMVVGLTGSAL